MFGYGNTTHKRVSLTVSGMFLCLWGGQTHAQVTANDLICTGCVDGTEIVNGTIGPNKLIPGSINANTIANNSIGPNKLIPGSINTSTIATDAIRSNKILDGSVQGADIADDAVSFSKLAPDVVAAIRGGPPGSPVVIDVNCALGESVQDAVNLAVAGDTINVTGTCVENVAINRNGVTLQGDPMLLSTIKPEDPAQSIISIAGASGIRIVDLTLDATTGQMGLVITNGDAALENLEILGAGDGSFTSSGVEVLQDSSATITGSVITGSDMGVLANTGGHAAITDSLIENCPNVGVLANRNGTAELRTAAGGGNIVRGNGDGIMALDGGAIRANSGTQIINNTNDGARAIRNGTLNIQGMLSGNGSDGVDLSTSSAAWLNGATVTNNGGSGVRLFMASSANISASSVSNNGDTGVRPSHSSAVLITSGSKIDSNGFRGVHALRSSSVSVENSTVDGNANRGVAISESSSARFADSSISNNGERGVWAYSNSAISLDGGNTVTGNNSYGVRANDDSVVHICDDNNLTGNTLEGLSLTTRSFGDVSTCTAGLESTLGDVAVDNQSKLEISSGTAASVTVTAGSTVIFNDFGSPPAPVIVSGNVNCFSIGSSPNFSSDALANGATPGSALSLTGGTTCPTLISQGF